MLFFNPRGHGGKQRFILVCQTPIWQKHSGILEMEEEY
jgi:hypothetical protein